MDAEPPAAGEVHDHPFDSADYLASVLDELVSPDRPATALFLAGGPLTGKRAVLSSLRRRGDELIPDDAVDVDPARIREHLPEFDALLAISDPYAADAVREEAEYLARELTRRAVADGRNLVVHGLGAGSRGAFGRLLARFREIGYEVRVLLVDCATESALERNELRARETKLRYDPAEIRRLHPEVSRRFDEWRELDGLRWEMYSTDPSHD